MPKGIHTAGLAVLFERAPTLDALAGALHAFPVAKRLAPGPEKNWLGTGHPSLLLAMRPEVNGIIAAAVIDAPWPDSMGDPKTDSMLFGAWSMGFFGPFAYPEGLSRAVQHAYGWRQAPEAVARHGAFVRLTVSYVFGLGQQAPVMPEGYSARTELEYLTRVARAVLGMSGAVALFNPSGEVLRPRDQIEELLSVHEEAGLLPLPVWSNVRMAKLGELPGWMLMDTVGMEQLEVEDHEACFQCERFEAAEVANFLRNTSEYARQQGDVVKDGDTTDGPGGKWRGYHRQSLMVPPRRTLRWVPGDAEVPEELK